MGQLPDAPSTSPGSFDLAAVFGDGFDTFPAATGGNFLVEILPMLF
jgi:hypothetical protein